MEYSEICLTDYDLFHELANNYYREGEDAQTPQEALDDFIHFLFQKVICHEIDGCFAVTDCQHIGFALWAIDTEAFAFREMPGFGTILEIGLIPSYRNCGYGKDLVSHIENDLRARNITQCYVSAYGPALNFWSRCGYTDHGTKASNGLPLMIKVLSSP